MYLYFQTVEDLEERVKKAGIDIVVRQSFLTDPTNAVKNLKVKLHAFFWDITLQAQLVWENQVVIFFHVFTSMHLDPKQLCCFPLGTALVALKICVKNSNVLKFFKEIGGLFF